MASHTEIKDILLTRVGWRQEIQCPITVSAENLTTDSGRYFQDEHSAVSIENIKDSIPFHAGAVLKDGKVVTSGGRVMAITSYGNTYQEAINKSYQSIEKLHFDKMNYRKDIGFDLN